MPLDRKERDRRGAVERPIQQFERTKAGALGGLPAIAGATAAEEIEAERQRQIETAITRLDSLHWGELVEEANKAGLIPPVMHPRLLTAKDTPTITSMRQYFIEKLPRESDPIKCAIVERLIGRIGGNAPRIAETGPVRL
jgi:hypothetical protein